MRFGWISPQTTCRCQSGGFPLWPVPSVTVIGTELPLSPYCNPLSAQLRQSRRFPQQSFPFLASFAEWVSRINTGDVMAVTIVPRTSDSPSPRKAGYTAHSVFVHKGTIRTALQVLPRSVKHPSIRRCIGAPQTRVSTETGS